MLNLQLVSNFMGQTCHIKNLPFIFIYYNNIILGLETQEEDKHVNIFNWLLQNCISLNEYATDALLLNHHFIVYVSCDILTHLVHSTKK